MDESVHTCQDCGDTIDVSVCHCGEGPNDSAHHGDGSHRFTPYYRCRCAGIREKIRAEFAGKLAVAKTEATLAERDACAQVAKDHAERLWHRGSWSGERDGALAVESAIRARTTTDTLSAEAIAKMAESCGMRLITPKYLADLVAMRAELEALQAAVDESEALDRERSEHGCGDSSCVVQRPQGMSTNGGCRCGRAALRAALQKARKELDEGPVLQWHPVAGAQPYEEAVLGEWTARAAVGMWRLSLRGSGGVVRFGHVRGWDIADSRRAAESELRALGVRFRTSGKDDRK